MNTRTDNTSNAIVTEEANNSAKTNTKGQATSGPRLKANGRPKTTSGLDSRTRAKTPKSRTASSSTRPSGSRMTRSPSSKKKKTKGSRRRRAKSAPPPVDILNPDAMLNLYYIAHNTSDALHMRGFTWAGKSPGKKKKKSKKKKRF